MSHEQLSHEDLALGQIEGMWESKVRKISSLSSQHCAVPETAMPKPQNIKITPPCSFPPPLENTATTTTCVPCLSDSLWPYELQPIRLIGFSRQEYWRGLPCPPPRDHPNPRLISCLLHWKADFLPLSPWEAQITEQFYLKMRQGGGDILTMKAHTASQHLPSNVYLFRTSGSPIPASTRISWRICYTDGWGFGSSRTSH